MKKKLSKTEARNKIDSLFKKEDFTSEEVRKIKRLAMSFQIRLGTYRKLFCKKCLSRLRGKIRIKGENKVVVCASCGMINRQSLV